MPPGMRQLIKWARKRRKPTLPVGSVVIVADGTTNSAQTEKDSQQLFLANLSRRNAKAARKLI